MNTIERLEELYKTHYSRIQKVGIEVNKQISNFENKLTNPLFIVPCDDYLNAKTKIMFFGQETNNWLIEDHDGLFGAEIDDLFDLYDDFYNMKKCFNYGKPFWNTIKKWIDSLNKANTDQFGYIYNNLVKIGRCGIGFPETHYKDFIRPLLNELVSKEIEILKPDILLFFTGPNYDFIIDDIFSNPQRNSISGFIEREFCELQIKNIKLAVRTYHPGYLNRNNRNRPISEYINKINEMICSKTNTVLFP